jgi:hypothetical protein
MNAAWTLGFFPEGWRRQHEQTFRPALDAAPAGFADTIDLLIGAANAHLRPDPAWPTVGAVSMEASRQAPGPRKEPLWTILLTAHISLFIIVNAILAVINLLVDPGTLWFLYPLWGWGIALALHVGITISRDDWFLAHLLTSATIGAGLIGINIALGGPIWAIWPVWALASLLAVHALHAAGKIDDFGAHLLGTVFAGLELLAAAIVLPDERIDIAFAMGYWLVGLAAHAMYRFGNPTLLQVHAVVFGLAMSLMALRSVAFDDSPWFVFPLVAWGMLLVAHGVVSRWPRRTGAAVWEAAMLSSLAANEHPSVDNRRARRSIRLSGLTWHALFFGVGALVLIALNVLAGGGWWLVWPVSVWLALFATHAGLLAFAGHPALGAYLFGGSAAAIWLFVLDMNTGGGTWWFWPVGVWAVGALIVVPLTVDLLQVVSNQQQHQVGRESNGQ